MENENPVTNNEQRRRFEMLLGEDKAAFIDYTEAGGGVLFATQNLDEVERFADRVVSLRDGRVDFAGDPREYAALAPGEDDA